MAGIGFELRKLLQRDSYSGLLQAYAYAGIISSGPWILSIVGILAIGLLSEAFVRKRYAEELEKKQRETFGERVDDAD